jgi:hypothetical protein
MILLSNIIINFQCYYTPRFLSDHLERRNAVLNRGLSQVCFLKSILGPGGLLGGKGRKVKKWKVEKWKSEKESMGNRETERKRIMWNVRIESELEWNALKLGNHINQ